MRRLCLGIILSTVSWLAHAGEDIWSRVGENPRQIREFESYEWTSPDGSAVLAYDENKGVIFKRGAFSAALNDLHPIAGLVEVGWEASGNGVFFNSTDGGAVGTWLTRVFVKRGASMIEVPVERIIRRVSPLRRAGGYTQGQNFGAIAWLDQGKTLLVAEAWPGSGTYGKAMGQGLFFIVDVQRNVVVKTLSPIEALGHTEWCRFWGPYSQAIFSVALPDDYRPGPSYVERLCGLQ